MPDAEAILHDLNDAQREAVTTVTGPVAIIAGAGSGKTRVVSHRAAYAVATGAVDERQILLVTFTDKAAREMATRVESLGLTQVTARTFHSAALAQLSYFWPLRHDGQPVPELMSDKWRIVSPLARALPGGYRYTPARDLMDEIEWAKSRRISAPRYESSVGTRTPPIPANLMARLYGDYERIRTRRGLIDFDDILLGLVELLETDQEAASTVRSRYAWFTVDEFQDTTPLQAQLLELWLGDRRDLCVVGDEDQTIYTFAGAAPEHLTGFSAQHPGAIVIPLLENYRSSPQVIAVANKLLASAGRSKRLIATQSDGPQPAITAYTDEHVELASIVEQVRGLLADGVVGQEIAVLLRMNAQAAPFEDAFTRAGIAFQVRGQRFFERREVKSAVRTLERLPENLVGTALVASVQTSWHEQLGYDPDETPDGREARERQATLSTLLSIVTELGTGSGIASSRDAVVDALAERAANEQRGSADGVELLTLHRAKGLEWDAVFIPSLEEGLLPVSQAKDEVAEAEELRLLYVGITRARRHLFLSWAQQRDSATGSSQRRKMSRFLEALDAPRPNAPRQARSAPGSTNTRVETDAVRERLNEADVELFDALRAWRLERARERGVSAFIVASNTTLAIIAETRPTTAGQLNGVRGVGPSTIELYGDDILDIVASA